MKKITILLIPIFLIVFGCKKKTEDQIANETSTNSCKDFALGQTIGYDIFKLVHQAAKSNSKLFTTLSNDTTIFGCDTITIDTSVTPYELIINFGSSCIGYDNVTRSGKLIAYFSNKYDSLNCLTTIQFDGYTYNDYEMVFGVYHYTNLGVIEGYQTYNFDVTSMKIQNGQNRKAYWTVNQNLAVIEGDTSSSTLDDKYSITGIGSGNTFDIEFFEAEIVSPIELAGNCTWPQTGTVSVTPENMDPRVLNFGNGTCDNEATVVVFGTPYDLIIP